MLDNDEDDKIVLMTGSDFVKALCSLPALVLVPEEETDKLLGAALKVTVVKVVGLCGANLLSVTAVLEAEAVGEEVADVVLGVERVAKVAVEDADAEVEDNKAALTTDSMPGRFSP